LNEELAFSSELLENPVAEIENVTDAAELRKNFGSLARRASCAHREARDRDSLGSLRAGRKPAQCGEINAPSTPRTFAPDWTTAAGDDARLRVIDDGAAPVTPRIISWTAGRQLLIVR